MPSEYSVGQINIGPAHIGERRTATLSMRVGKTVHQWPITMFPWAESADSMEDRVSIGRTDNVVAAATEPSGGEEVPFDYISTALDEST